MTHRSSIAQPTTAPASVKISLDATAAPIEIPSNFLGLGYETSAVAQSAYFSRENHRLIQLYRNLGTDGLIRIGGNISDHTQYIADGTPTVVDEKKTTIITKQNLDDLAAFARETGWQVMWGLNLGSGTKEQAVEEALAVEHALGDRLQSFQIGNEVDLLKRFDKKYVAYHAAFREYKSAIRAALPTAKFSGPDTAWDMEYVDRFVADEGGDLVNVTTHYYRGGAVEKRSTIERLLEPDNDFATRLDRLRNTCGPRRLVSRINEVNSFYGGGKKGVSDTFASALWALDYCFLLASHGCGGVNIQTDINQLGFISHYSPIVHDQQGVCSARPEYYGLLAFATAGRGKLLPTKIEVGDANVTAYVTQSTDDTMFVVVINKDSTRDVEANCDLPRRIASVQISRLIAPALEATSGVMLGDAAVKDDGKFEVRSTKRAEPDASALQLSVPHGSAAVVRCTVK